MATPIKGKENLKHVTFMLWAPWRFYR